MNYNLRLRAVGQRSRARGQAPARPVTVRARRPAAKRKKKGAR